MRLLAAALLLTPVGRAWAEPAATDKGSCIDETIKADLDAKRRKRGVKERLFQKTNRHELSVRGGYYVSDVFDGSPTGALAYTYHLTEEFGVEASGSWTRIRSAAVGELERLFEVLGNRDRNAYQFATNLVFAPLYAKMQSGDAIVRFDVVFTAGAGVVDSAVASGVAGNAGIGFVLFGGRAFAVRLDVRDYVYRQQLLAERVWVNDPSATLGLSLFLPFQE